MHQQVSLRGVDTGDEAMIGINQLSKIIGCTQVVLLAMVKDNLFPPARKVPQQLVGRSCSGGQHVWAWPASEKDKLVQIASEAIAAKNNVGRNELCLALRVSYQKLLQWIEEGRILRPSVYGRARGLGKIAWPRSALNALLEQGRKLKAETPRTRIPDDEEGENEESACSRLAANAGKEDMVVTPAEQEHVDPKAVAIFQERVAQQDQGVLKQLNAPAVIQVVLTLPPKLEEAVIGFLQACKFRMASSSEGDTTKTDTDTGVSDAPPNLDL